MGPHAGHAVAFGAEPHGALVGGRVDGIAGALGVVALAGGVDGGVQGGAAGPVTAGQVAGQAGHDIGFDTTDDVVGNAGQAAGGVDGQLLGQQPPLDGLAQARQAGVDLHAGGDQVAGVPAGQGHRRGEVVAGPVGRVQAGVRGTGIGAGLAVGGLVQRLETLDQQVCGLQPGGSGQVLRQRHRPRHLAQRRGVQRLQRLLHRAQRAETERPRRRRIHPGHPPPRAASSLEPVIDSTGVPFITQGFDTAATRHARRRQRRPSHTGGAPLSGLTGPTEPNRQGEPGESGRQAPLDLPADFRSLHASTTRSDMACSAFLRYERGS